MKRNGACVATPSTSIADAPMTLNIIARNVNVAVAGKSTAIVTTIGATSVRKVNI